MNDQMCHLYAQSVHQDRVAEAERLAALRAHRASHRGTIRHTMALGLHRLADSIDPSRPSRIHPSPSH
ncbi:hypothetical protein AB0B45_01825 [Nonomuraea sp. NPDC049152]|uniref:hypothetical protein n=1 Tax=Nonomuraea sp. NPDC049152 TaxID=3154350 RepID=UPI0033F32FB2